MKFRTHLPSLAALAAAAAALLVGTPSHAASYSFSQTGFDGGASITGSFAGEDGDGDDGQGVEPDVAAAAIADGLRTRRFEIHFPRKFTLLLKLLRLLPYGLSLRLTRNITT